MKLNEVLSESRFKKFDVQYKDTQSGKKVSLVLNGTSKNAIEVALRQPNIKIISIKELKEGAEGLLERKKNVKLAGVGSTGLTNKKELDFENQVEDALRKKFGLKRGIDFVFRRNAVQFTNASDVSSKVVGALKGFVAEEVIGEATLRETERIIGFLNREFLPSFSRERHDVFSDNDLLDKGANIRRDAKIFLKDIRQSQFERDLKGMERFVRFNPWVKWTNDVIETSDLFDHVDGLAAKKREFQEFQKDAKAFIEEVKKLLFQE